VKHVWNYIGKLDTLVPLVEGAKSRSSRVSEFIQYMSSVHREAADATENEHNEHNLHSNIWREKAVALADAIKLECKTRPHPIVKNSLRYAHHSYTFYRTDTSFNPPHRDGPDDDCWFCGKKEADNQKHLVRECEADLVQHILKDGASYFKWNELADLRDPDYDLLASWLLTPYAFEKSDDSLLSSSMRRFIGSDWYSLSEIHFRLYRHRKSLRDAALQRECEVGINSRHQMYLLQCDVKRIATRRDPPAVEWRYFNTNTRAAPMRDPGSSLLKVIPPSSLL